MRGWGLRLGLALLITAPAWATPADFSRWELHQRATIETYNQAIVQLGEGNLIDAEKAFEVVVRREAKAAVGWYGLAIVWLRQNRASQAIPILEQVASEYA